MLSAADFRAEIARKRVRLYVLAGRVGLHPSRLGAFLNERAPLPPGLEARIRLALDELHAGVQAETSAGRGAAGGPAMKATR